MPAHINFFSSVGFFLSAFCFILAFVVYKKSYSKTHQLFAFFNILVALWGLGTVLAGFSENAQEAIKYWRLAYVPATFIPIIFYHFICLYSSVTGVLFKRLSYLYGLIFSPIILFSNKFINSTSYLFNLFYYFNSSNLFSFWLILWFIITIFAFVKLYQFCARIPSKSLEAKFLFWSMLLGFLGGSSTVLPGYGFKIYPIFQISICFYAIIIFYLILKHDFLNLSVVIKQSLIYTIFIALLSSGFLLMIFLTEHFLQGLFHYQSLQFSLLIAFLLGFAINPIRDKLQRYIDRIFFKGTAFELAEENKFLKNEVSQKEKFKSIATFASSMAHDIKSPLTAIKTYFEYFPQKKNDPQFLEDFQRIVGSEISRINDLTNNLLEFAKPSPLQLQPTNINALLEKSLTLLHHQLVQNNINVVRHLDSTDSIQADPNKLTQAFLNLILNAIEAMPDGGTLTVSTKSNKDHIEIEIQDTGIGIPEKDLQNIFKPFFTQKEKGTGLGLAIVEEIIKNHNGAIKVKSVKGKGTSFELEFEKP